MFGRREEIPMVSPAEIDAFQRDHDTKTLAATAMENVIQESLDRGAHPWDNANGYHVKLALLAIAEASDVTAETMRGQLDLTKTDKDDRIQADIAHFTLGLCVQADRVFETTGFEPNQAVPFTDEQLLALDAENNLPYWPAYPNEQHLPEWQTSEVIATGLFVVRTAQAAYDMNARAYNLLTRMEEYGDQYPIPEFYGSVRQVVDDLFITDAQASLSSANLEAASDDHVIAAEDLVDTYRTVHDAYVKNLRAYIAVAAPATLGHDFVLDKEPY